MNEKQEAVNAMNALKRVMKKHNIDFHAYNDSCESGSFCVSVNDRMVTGYVETLDVNELAEIIAKLEAGTYDS